APGMGPQYRANMTAVRNDGTHVVNPWPPVQSTEVTLGIPPTGYKYPTVTLLKPKPGRPGTISFISIDPAALRVIHRWK
ncbi:MAG: hypothetical protein PHR56_07745, partial [Dehalococcoidales bacterium]|nr:hypothetical protein [Dehalococcoidales bacterium]